MLVVFRLVKAGCGTPLKDWALPPWLQRQRDSQREVLMNVRALSEARAKPYLSLKYENEFV